MQKLDFHAIKPRLLRAIRFRAPFVQTPYDTAFRLINGFTEHLPGLVIDIFAKTAVIHDYSANGSRKEFFELIQDLLLNELPWLKTILLKSRTASRPEEKNGTLLYGGPPDRLIREYDTAYTVDLMLNRDNSFYCDTRNLRQWLIANMNGRSLLNTFAYTGSLGIAALAGNASRVVQTDLSGKFLSLAEKSYQKNVFSKEKTETLIGNFFPVISRLRKTGESFDCVILDPPYFSKTDKGSVDLMQAPLALINKVRPLVADNGHLIVINNALFLSGEAFLNEIDSICDGVCLSREEFISVPSDFTGSDSRYMEQFQSDPSPFNHPTKIVILRIRKKRKE